MGKPSIADENQFVALIQQYLKSADRSGADTIIGIGDDGAVTAAGQSHLVHTADALVDGVHFRSADISPYELGYKSIAVSQSDIAAMGGEPQYALVTLGGAPLSDGEWVQSFLSGISDALGKYGGVCVGGDTVSSGTLFVSVAMTGALLNNEVNFARGNAARAGGDMNVYVTGALGAAAGWLQTQNDALRRAHFLPTPRVDWVRDFVKSPVPLSAIDISDGLLTDLERMARAMLSALADSSGSSVSLEITLSRESIPVSPLLRSLVTATEALELALNGGEDYELLLAAPDKFKLDETHGVFRIGHIKVNSSGESGITIELAGGDKPRERVTPHGWDHLREKL